MPPKKAPEPVELSTPKLIGHVVLLLICITLLVIGGLGMHVLLGKPRSSFDHARARSPDYCVPLPLGTSFGRA